MHFTSPDLSITKFVFDMRVILLGTLILRERTTSRKPCRTHLMHMGSIIFRRKKSSLIARGRHISLFEG